MSFITELVQLKSQLAQLQQQHAALRDTVQVTATTTTIGYKAANITLYSDGNVTLTGYSKDKKRVVTITLDDIINVIDR